MAGRGPAAQKQHTRARNDKPTIKLIADGKKRGPALPPMFKNGKRVAWHVRTRAWWEHWRSSPQAIHMMTSPDWDFLLDTALMHHEMWSNGKWELAAEVRLRVQKFGATPEDRSRLRVEIGGALPNESSVGKQAAGGAMISSMADERWARLSGDS